MVRLWLYGLGWLVVIGLAWALDKPEYVLAMVIGSMGMGVVEGMKYMTETKYGERVKTVFRQCYLECHLPVCEWLTQFRGRRYFLTNGDGNGKVKYCMLSLWGVLHFVLFVLIGLFVPNIGWEVLGASLVYEGGEYVLYQCHDLLDVGINMAGYLVGSFVARRVGLTKKLIYS
jgi:hypothetical protein